MPREKRYESDAERQQAYRERKKAESILEEEPVLSSREQRLKLRVAGLEIDVSDEPISNEEALGAARVVPASSVEDPAAFLHSDRPAAVKERVVEAALSELQKPLTELEEQQLRDHHRYTASERRTKAERDEAARTMLARSDAGIVKPYAPLTEEVYVAQQLEEAKRSIARMLRPHIKAPQDPDNVVDKTSPQAIKERLERVEKYARWRYRGFVEGEIASL
jgi:FtsZ-interacting cell division protein ZipA